MRIAIGLAKERIFGRGLSSVHQRDIWSRGTALVWVPKKRIFGKLVQWYGNELYNLFYYSGTSKPLNKERLSHCRLHRTCLRKWHWCGQLLLEEGTWALMRCGSQDTRQGDIGFGTHQDPSSSFVRTLTSPESAESIDPQWPKRIWICAQSMPGRNNTWATRTTTAPSCTILSRLAKFSTDLDCHQASWGWELANVCQTPSAKIVFSSMKTCFSPAVESSQKPLGSKFIDMIRKHLHLMRIPEYNMLPAAIHLETWIDGLLPVDPFVDVSASLWPNFSIVLGCIELWSVYWKNIRSLPASSGQARFLHCSVSQSAASIPAQPKTLEQRANVVSSPSYHKKELFWFSPNPQNDRKRTGYL